jgi:hypothetical protein
MPAYIMKSLPYKARNGFDTLNGQAYYKWCTMTNVRIQTSIAAVSAATRQQALESNMKTQFCAPLQLQRCRQVADDAALPADAC